jgi:tyrosine-protein kinase Etk/Wzc
VGLVADTYALEEVADLSLFILRQKYSYKTTLKFIENLYKEKKFKQLSIVVNGITDMKGFGYGYGYGYGYYYKDNYYGEEHRKSLLTKIFYKSI